MLKVVPLIFILLGPILALQRSDCVNKCHHLDSPEFGKCYENCSKDLADFLLFSLPPSNVTAKTEVVMEEGKILETTVTWNAPKDDRRTGFYLRLSALGPECSKHFFGYFTSSISPEARSHRIPLEFNGYSLIFDHLCTYQIQMHSIPYPAGDVDFLTVTNHTVAECVDGYCACKPNAIGTIDNIEAKEHGENAILEWDFVQANDRLYTFYVDVYQRMTSPIKFRDENAFKFQIANEDSFQVSPKQEHPHFKYIVPFDFDRNQTYKLSVFVVDDQFCHTSDVQTTFQTSSEVGVADETTTEPTLVEKTTMTSTTTTIEPTIAQSKIMLDSTFFIVMLVLVACVSPLCTILLLFIWKRRDVVRKRRATKFGDWTLSHSRRSIMETNVLYRAPAEFGADTNDFLVRAADITSGVVIGEGAFGMVCKGTLRTANGHIRVAIKQLKANAVDEEKSCFISEIRIMQIVGHHPNIVSMYGYCMEEELNCMLMEYVPFGDLKHYLQNLRNQILANNQAEVMTSSINETLQYSLDPLELQSFAAQVANGMSHLESLGVTHRDLAARNILVGDSKVLKISDFGMSRTGIYVKMSKGVIPLRWLSPEAINDSVYSTKSDVWAYGVVLWEIVTLGGFPYSTIGDKELLKHLMEGNRLEKPLNCSAQIFELMLACWADEPKSRPSFVSICDTLGTLKCPYVDFTPHTSLPPHDGPIIV